MTVIFCIIAVIILIGAVVGAALPTSAAFGLTVFIGVIAAWAWQDADRPGDSFGTGILAWCLVALAVGLLAGALWGLK